MCVHTSLPKKISYLQLDAVINMLRFFNIVYDKKLDEVVTYFKSNVIFMVNAFQQVTTNLRNENQTVMMWYCDDSLCTKEEERMYAGILSLYYQYLSLVSYGYDFVVTI